MPKAYSLDLREKLILAVEREGLSCREAARQFRVSAASAVKWLQRYRRTGEMGPVGTGGHRPSVLAPERAWLFAVISAVPDITLGALSARLLVERGVRADTSMLSRFLRREGLSFKKNPARQRARSAGRGPPPSAVETLSGSDRSPAPGVH